MSVFCRICLFAIPDPAKSVNVYLRTADSVSIIDVMKECTSIQVMDPDDLPKFVCTSCVVKLNFVYEFRNLIIGSDMRLKMQLQYSRKLIPQSSTTNHVINEPMKSNIDEIEIKEEPLLDTSLYENTTETFIPPAENTTQRVEDRPINIEYTMRKEDLYNCTECDKSFNLWDHFKQHKLEHSGEKPWFSCKFCNKEFYTKWTLTMHTKIHKQYSCKECDKRFWTPNDLVVHERIHKGLKKYECTECNREFNDSTRFIVHMRHHSGEKPYLCEICGKTFKEGLSAHLKCHQGAKLVCPVCGKSCSRAALREHIKTHSGAKPYVCEECGKKFTAHTSLKTHKKAVHFGIRAHKCKVCEKSFSQSCILVKHMLIHSGEKPFPCKLCPKEFAYKQHLQSHMKKCHESVGQTLISDKCESL